MCGWLFGKMLLPESLLACPRMIESKVREIWGVEENGLFDVFAGGQVGITLRRSSSFCGWVSPGRWRIVRRGGRGGWLHLRESCDGS